MQKKNSPLPNEEDDNEMIPHDGIHTGGCQCGAVRFRMEGTPDDRSICHCRMCQKAFGNFYAPLVNTRSTKFEWTRGEPKRWRSSNHVQRGFCGECGTPLTYEAEDGLAVSIAAFDDPSPLMPVIQYGVEAKVEWLDDLVTLPAHHTMDDADSAPFLKDIVSYQHPDHDTDVWPPEPAKETGDG